jgi:hypothetical protein
MYSNLFILTNITKTTTTHIVTYSAQRLIQQHKFPCYFLRVRKSFSHTKARTRMLFQNKRLKEVITPKKPDFADNYTVISIEICTPISLFRKVSLRWSNEENEVDKARKGLVTWDRHTNFKFICQFSFISLGVTGNTGFLLLRICSMFNSSS